MLRHRFRLTALLMLGFLVTPVSATVTEYMLDNGMKLIVKQDHRAPVVVSQVWYKVGASYEHAGITGVSHVLEHMMFKGTKKHAPGEFSKIIAANGGRENAFTGQDYTAYFQRLEKSRLPISFELEADRMRNVVILAEEFAKEIKVVMEERRLRTEDKPTSLLYERFRETAYQTSPYKDPVIGWMHDLENMNVDDLKQWYQDWYAPNNATLVVAGDVKPEDVLALAKKHFGPIKSGKVRVLKPQLEVEQKGEKRIIVKAPAQVPYLLMGYKTPVVNTAKEKWEPYALEVLAGILDGGSSARFARELVRGKQIAASAGSGYDMYSRLEDMLLLDGTPATGHSIADLEKALREQIKRLHSEPVTDAELKRIKAQVVASKIYGQDSIFYQAMQIGTLETVGLDWRLMDTYVDSIRAVTAEQVQAVAKKYLVDDRLTVAILKPVKSNGAKQSSLGSSINNKEVAHAAH